MANQYYKTNIIIDGSVQATGARVVLSDSTETTAVMVNSSDIFSKRQLGTAAFLSPTAATNASMQTATTTASRNYEVQNMAEVGLMVNVPWTNTTYSAYAGGTSPGTAALVPARDAGSTTAKYLREDGDWVIPPNTTYNKASFDLDHLFTLVGATADTAENMGTYTYSTVTDNQSLKTNISDLQKKPDNFILACSDETTALTASADPKVTFRVPYAFRLSSVRASVNTAPTGANISIDITAAGTSIFNQGEEEGVLLSIDATEKTSTTAGTAFTFANGSGEGVQYVDIQDDAEIQIILKTIGSTVAGTGLKVTLLGIQL